MSLKTFIHHKVRSSELSIKEQALLAGMEYDLYKHKTNKNNSSHALDVDTLEKVNRIFSDNQISEFLKVDVEAEGQPLDRLLHHLGSLKGELLTEWIDVSEDGEICQNDSAKLLKRIAAIRTVLNQIEAEASKPMSEGLQTVSPIRS